MGHAHGNSLGLLERAHQSRGDLRVPARRLYSGMKHAHVVKFGRVEEGEGEEEEEEEGRQKEARERRWMRKGTCPTNELRDSGPSFCSHGSGYF